MRRPTAPAGGRPARADRTLTALLGLLAVAVGAAALLVGTEVFGGARAHRPVIDPILVKRVAGNLDLTLGIAIAVGVLLVVLGLWWALRELRPERHPDIVLDSSLSRELTVTSAALASAVRGDAETVTGVDRARVRVLGRADAPGLRLTLWLREGADVRDVWAELDTRVLARARHALGIEVLPAAIRIELDAAERQRVV